MIRAALGFATLTGVFGAASACGGGDSGPRGGATSPGAGGTGTQMPTSRPSMRTVVYLPSYRGQLSSWSRQLEFQNISYVNLSFVEVDAAGNVRFPDAGFVGFVATAQAAGAKVCVALGGATTIDTGGVFATLLEDDKRPAFVEKLVTFVADNQLDCLDIDLEGNGVNDRYEAFVTELALRLKPQGRELTAAVAGWFGDKISDAALARFDFVNVMAYDLYSSNRVPGQYSSIEAATREVDEWAMRMPKEKVVYGVPFYGMRWPQGGGQAPEIIGYGDLLRTDAAAATSDELQSAGTITYLNSRSTIQTKAIVAKNYGGIMAWEAGQDATGDESLLRAIRAAVQ